MGRWPRVGDGKATQRSECWTNIPTCPHSHPPLTRAPTRPPTSLPAAAAGGKLSQLQLEGVLYACAKHLTWLPSGERCGFFIGAFRGGGGRGTGGRFCGHAELKSRRWQPQVAICPEVPAVSLSPTRCTIPSLLFRTPAQATGPAWARAARSAASSWTTTAVGGASRCANTASTAAARTACPACCCCCCRRRRRRFCCCLPRASLSCRPFSCRLLALSSLPFLSFCPGVGLHVDRPVCRCLPGPARPGEPHRGERFVAAPCCFACCGGCAARRLGGASRSAVSLALAGASPEARVAALPVCPPATCR